MNNQREVEGSYKMRKEESIKDDVISNHSHQSSSKKIVKRKKSVFHASDESHLMDIINISKASERKKKYDDGL